MNPSNLPLDFHAGMTRRQLFGRASVGIGTAALASLLNGSPATAEEKQAPSGKKNPRPSDEEMREEMTCFEDVVTDPVDFQRAKTLMGWVCEALLATMQVVFFENQHFYF